MKKVRAKGQGKDEYNSDYVEFKKAYKNWRAAKWFREKFGAYGTPEQKSLSSVLWRASKHLDESISKFVTSVIDPLSGECFAP